MAAQLADMPSAALVGILSWTSWLHPRICRPFRGICQILEGSLVVISTPSSDQLLLGVALALCLQSL